MYKYTIVIRWISPTGKEVELSGSVANDIELRNFIDEAEKYKSRILKAKKK